jgi:peptidoglycan/xylan/chitin deacetylase (PgdA/CDA1 family)
MSVLRQMLKSAATLLLPRSVLLTHGAPRSANGELEIALTFDDGPHPEHTPRLLDQLAEHHACGTFFVIGERAARHPDIVRRIVDEGHELGNHTWSHSEPRQTTSPQFLAEVDRTRKWLEDFTGQPSRWMRPPKGRLSFRKFIGLWQRQQTIVLWNVDPKDYSLLTDSEPLRKWACGYRPSSGDIVLMHDHHPHAATALPDLFSRTDLAIRTVTLSQWFADDQRSPTTAAPRSEALEVIHVR